jgi:hypothetical protein
VGALSDTCSEPWPAASVMVADQVRVGQRICGV